LVDELEEFLAGVRTGADPDRMLTTLLFTDIVNSTTLAAQSGDRRWRDVLDQHHQLGRASLPASAARRSRRRGTAASRPSTVR
jgi:class 3 adenylate cyclase